jgi:hypothetical protein
MAPAPIHGQSLLVECRVRRSAFSVRRAFFQATTRFLLPLTQMINSLADCADLSSDAERRRTLNAKRRTLNAFSDVGLLQIKRLQRGSEARPALDEVFRFRTNDRQVGKARKWSDRKNGPIAQPRP